MLGLVLKDFRLISTMHKNKIRYIVAIVSMISFILILEGQGALVFPLIFIPLEILSIIVTLFSSDEESKWSYYAITFPISKKNIVLSRYIFVFINIIILTFFALMANVVCFVLFHQFTLMIHIMSVVGVSILTMFLASLLLVFSYFTNTNASIIVIALSLLLLLIITFITENLEIDIVHIISTNFNLLLILIYVILFVTLLVSFALSVYAFSKKYQG